MSGSHSGVPLKSTLLMRLEVLIRQAREQLKQFTDGKTQFIAYVRALREQIQHCLVDIVDRGEPAQEDLREVIAMDLSISDELAAWYAKGVYNDFQVKEGDPADFLRAQAEYDRTMPAKIQRMIDILQTVRGKMLGTVPSASPTPVPQAGSPPHVKGTGEPKKPYSKRDHALYKLIGSEDLARFTDAELWKRNAKDFRTMQPPGRKATLDAFRARLFRIRQYHGVPTPKL
ncbi:MAG TPA: hypothetical protein VG206_10065 [Terriglobia bacterium]|nr:hypothetical protein [Terriglobia bacterium]